MPSTGAVRNIHWFRKSPAATAEAMERAGFMEVPDKGDSSAMYNNSSSPAKTPVYGAVFS